MILINCPYCGERDQSEFSNGGEAHVARPENSENLSDKEWGEYVFYRANPKGIFYERWVHSHGCRKWFNAVRDTSTDEILKIYKLDEKTPELKDFSKETLEPIINNLIKLHETNFKGVGQPLRVVLTGSKFGPGVYDIILSLGKEETLKRLENKILS